MALDSFLLVSPITVLLRILELCTEPFFYKTIGFSLLRIASGFLLGFTGGVVLAALASRIPLVHTLLWPYLTVMKATPVASFIILCLIWLKAENLSVFISFVMVLPIVYTNLLEGIQKTDPKMKELAKVFRLGYFRKLIFIDIPQLAPYLLAAAHITLGLAWKAGIAAEVIGIPTGSIGEQLYEAKVYLSSADLFAWTIVLILVSALFEKLIIFLLQTGFTRLKRL